jgi:hypothetical protein
LIENKNGRQFQEESLFKITTNIFCSLAITSISLSLKIIILFSLSGNLGESMIYAGGTQIL